jgi:hypothetical protein
LSVWPAIIFIVLGVITETVNAADRGEINRKTAAAANKPLLKRFICGGFVFSIIFIAGNPLSFAGNYIERTACHGKEILCGPFRWKPVCRDPDAYHPRGV